MITVFTPTYNRAYCLGNLFNSLCYQTYTDFEWLIVDDGSTDNTKSLVEGFCCNSNINIRYVYQKNGGKHRAINRGVAEARGELFFIVDSDDTLPSDSLETISVYAQGINWRDDGIAGVSGVRIYSNGVRIGGTFPFDELICNAIELRDKYHVKGDMAEVWVTSILKEYQFPTFLQEKFVTESVVWYRIAKTYKIKYFNKPIYQCEYLEDGLSRNIRRIHRNSPKGSMLYCIEMIQNSQVSLLSKLKATINYWRYTIHYKGERPKELLPYWWMWLFWPLGYMFYRRDLK